MLYQFRKYAHDINLSQNVAVPENGFEFGGTARHIAINFDDFNPRTPFTVVCSGARRGGTSTLPYILSRFGLPMGESETDAYEDSELLRSRHSVERLEEVIAKRNAANKSWGFKIPSLRRGQLGFFEAKLRNPVFLYIFRNPLQAAQSYLTQVENSETFPKTRSGLAGALSDTLTSYIEFTAFMNQTRSPCLLLSMEQLQRVPVSFLEDLAARLGLDVKRSVIEDLVETLPVPGFKPRIPG